MQADLEAMWPAQIKFYAPGGLMGPFLCSGGEMQQLGEELRLGGMFADFDLGFRIRKELLSFVPSVGQRIEFLERIFRIGKFSIPQSDVVYVIGCEAVTK